MSTAKTYTSTGSYTRYNRLLPGSSDGVWRGVDFSSEASLVDQTRLAYCVNMWRDYECDNGGCIESFPGYRQIRQGGNGKMHGMWHFRKDDVDYIIIHCGTKLRYFKASDRDLSVSDYTTISDSVNDADSQAFVFNGSFYLLDGNQYRRVSDDMTDLIAVADTPSYAPITYSDELEYEQRNMLTNSFIERWNIVDASEKIVDGYFGMTLSVSGSTVTISKINSTRSVVYIPSSFTVNGNEYTDIQIGNSAFQNNKQIKSVVIMGCSSIGTYAFKGCSSLRSVQILSCTSIGGNAFENCTALENIMIGKCTTIGAYAFSGCTKLVNAVILSCASIGSSSFASCTGLIRVAIHECFGAIGANAFRDCPNLLEVWAGSYTSISTTAFGDNVEGYPISNVLFMSGKADENTAFDGSRIVTVLPNSRIVLAIVNSTVTTDLAGGSYDELIKSGGAINERKLLTLSVGSVNTPMSANTVWTLPIVAPSPIDHLRFKAVSGDDVHFGITALPDGLIITEDENDSTSVLNAVTSSYYYNYAAVIDKAVVADFYILDPCTAISKLTLDGVITGGVEKSIPYTLIAGTTETSVSGTSISGVSIEIIKEDGYWSLIRVYLAGEDLLDDCEMRLYGTAQASTFTAVKNAANYQDANPGYTSSSIDAINKCTICTVFDGRPFFTGNPSLPNTVFYASRRSDTGVIDPSYIGVCNFFNDGTGNNKNNALLAAGTTLMVFKEKSGENGSIYYHVGRETGLDFLPKDYPSTEGTSGFDCLGSAYNFLDDYVFVTVHGLDAVDKAQLNLERTIGHRSSNIDRILLGKDLSRVRMTEWKGYLVLLADGDIFLADSRKMFTNATGSAEYEWFRLSGIGYYDSQRQKTVTETGDLLTDGYLLTQAVLKTTGEPLHISEIQEEVEAADTITDTFVFPDGTEKELTYLPSGMIAVSITEEYVGGGFSPAKEVLSINGVLYLACDYGNLFCVNTDKRGYNLCEYAKAFPDVGQLYYYDGTNYQLIRLSNDIGMTETKDRITAYYNVQGNTQGRGYYYEYGTVTVSIVDGVYYLLEAPMNPASESEFAPEYYTFAGRRYLCEMATRFDDCGSPYLSKNTIKNSVVIAAKTAGNSNFETLVRTERDEWKKIERTVSSRADFTDMSFDMFSFRSKRELIYISKEHKNKWVKKQFCFRCNCFMEPFGIYNIGYGYYFHGKVRI